LRRFNRKQGKVAELTGVLSYSILDNPNYQQMFQYWPKGLEEREAYMLDDFAVNALG
jgi:hypothetical protein